MTITHGEQRKVHGDEARAGLVAGMAEMCQTAVQAADKSLPVGVRLSRSSAALRNGCKTIAERHGDLFAPELFEDMANHADAMGDALAALREAATASLPRTLAVATLSDEALALASTLSLLAESFRDPGPGNERFSEQPAQIRRLSVDAAFALTLAAHDLRMAAGLPEPRRSELQLPGPKGCGCGGKKQQRIDAAVTLLPTGIACTPPRVWDPQEIERSVEELSAAVALFLALFAHLGGFYLLLAGLGTEWYHIACSDDCTGPHGTVISVTPTRFHATVGIAAAQPMVDGDVELCCRNRCFGGLREWDVEIVSVTTTCGNPVNTAAQALRIATANGPAALRAFVRRTPPACPALDPGP